jgi:hypothetical protein
MQDNRTIYDDRGQIVAVYDPTRRVLLMRQRYKDASGRHQTRIAEIPVDDLIANRPITVETVDYAAARKS